MKFLISLNKFFLLILITSFIIILFENFLYQYSPEPLPPNDLTFSGIRAHEFWKYLCEETPKRFIGTPNYNISYSYVLNNLKQLINDPKKSSNIEISLTEQLGNISSIDSYTNNEYQNDVRNILFKISPKGSTIPPLLIDAHIDSKNTGPGAYDVASGVSIMLELAHILTKSSKTLNIPIILLFVGIEEQEYQGAMYFVKQNVSITAFLNIESLGPGLPAFLLQKGEGSSEIVRAWSKTPRMIVLTMIDDIIKTKLIAPSTDTAIFKKHHLSGAEILYIGNPTKYHTKKDSLGSPNHLQLVGNSILNMIYNYDINKINEPSASIGVSPFVITLTDKIRYMISPLFGFICLSFLIYPIFLEDKGIYNLFITLISFLIPFIFSVIGSILLSYFLNLYNSVSYVMETHYTFIILFILQFIIFYYIHLLFNYSKDQLQILSLLIISIFAIITKDLDVSLIFILFCPFLLFSYIFRKFTLISLIFTFIGFFPLFFFWVPLFRSFILYTMLLPDFVGELVPFILIILIFFFLILIFLPFLISLNEINFLKIFPLIIYLILILFLFLKNSAISDNFNVQGIISHAFDGSNESIVTYSPPSGKRLIQQIIKLSKNSSELNYNYSFLSSNTIRQVIYKKYDGKIPTFIKNWPKFTFEKFLNNTIKFEMKEKNEYCVKVDFIIDCPIQNCLNKVQYIEELSIFKNNSFKYHLRYSPSNNPFSMNFYFKEFNEKIQFKLIFSYYKWTNEIESFLNLLPENVLPYGEDGIYYLDTVLINNTII